MKKITAFFMAFFPIFVVILLFVSGLLIKNVIPITVQSVQISSDSLEIKKPTDEQPTAQLEAHVLPMNASNPDIYWTSSDTSVATVDRNTGEVTAQGFGEAKIYATSAENFTISATCDVEVWDDKIHSINIVNDYGVSYMGVGQKANLEAKPMPEKRLVGNSALVYESSNTAVAEVSTDGEVTAKTEGNATITVTCEDKETYPTITNQIDITVGKGITSIGYDSDSKIEIKDRNYELYPNLIVYPEQSQEEKKLITEESFAYSSSNEEIATVDEKGKVTFRQSGEATFHVVYKGNKNVKTTKTIKSSGGVFNDVSFNRFSFTDDKENYPGDSPYIDEKNLNAHVYPEGASSEGLRVRSTNPDVITVEEGTGKYKVVGAGTTTLIAEILSEDGKVITDDRCAVNITDKTANKFINEKVELTDTAYYWLRTNVNKNVLNNEHQRINWTVTPSSPGICDLDEYNEIIHFKDVGSATISDSDGNSFTIECTYSDIERLNPDASTFNVEVGKRYAFESDDVIWTPTFSTSTRVDILPNNAFIIRAGGTDKNVIISNGTVTKQGIVLKIKEDPLDIWYDHTESGLPNLVTASSEVIFGALAWEEIIPYTASNDDGERISLKYEYKPRHSDTTIIVGDSITFFYPDTVDITASAKDITKEFSIKSTCGGASKFLLYDDENAQLYSGQTISLAKGQEKTLFINNSNFVKDIESVEKIAQSIKVTTLNGDIVEISNVKADGATGKVWFTVKGSDYGNETLIISSVGFKFYLNVNISPEITDFDLAYNYEILTSPGHNKIVTYQTGITLDVLLNSPSLAQKQYTYSFNGGADTLVTNNKITLPDDETIHEGDNTLLLKANDGGYQEEFTITKKKIQDLSYSLANVNDSTMYIPAGSTSTTITINTDGIVPDSVFEDFNFVFQGTLSHERKGNKVYLTGIPPATDDKPWYENKFTVKYTWRSAPEEYTLSRETITKILFPHHDNLDKNDQKGLQQVHVFGTKSIYSEEEGMIDYYRLPLEIYDYKGSKLTGDKKQEAWEKLAWITNDETRVEYDVANDGYLKVFFDVNQTYTPEDIYNDKFAGADKHNTQLTVCTPSKSVSRSYEFVTVDGINSYCQKAFEGGNKTTVVLQTSFGPEADEQTALYDNGDYDSFGTIIGNGYTINFDCAAMNEKQEPDDRHIDVWNIFNTKVVGCSLKHWMKNRFAINVHWGEGNSYYAYNIYSFCYKGGVHLYKSGTTHVKRCLFYNNGYAAVNVNSMFAQETTTTCYVEDCVFFNAASTSITLALGANLYLKGFVDVYNFINKNTLSNIDGLNLSVFYDIIVMFGQEAGVMHDDAPDGMLYLNSVLFSPLQSSFYMWDDSAKKYVSPNDTGIGQLSDWKMYLSITLPIVGGLQLWSTLNRAHSPTAPNYYDEFSSNGELRIDLMNSQLAKLQRIRSNIIIYPY